MATDNTARSMVNEVKKYTDASISDINANLVTKASQSDLDATNATVITNKNSVDLQLATKASMTQYSNQQSQINAIVLQGTSGDSSAEVVQSRINSDGSTFSTIKSHLDDVENVIKTGVSKYCFGTWEQGGTEGITGGNNNDPLVMPIRIRTGAITIPSLIPLTNNTFTVNVASGFSAGFLFYTDAACTQYIFDTGFVTGTTAIVKRSDYMRIYMKNNSGADINASQGGDLLYINYEIAPYVVNDSMPSDKTTYSSSKINDHLLDVYGVSNTLQTEIDRHILRINDIEKSVNFKNIAIDDYGNMNAEIINTNAWAEYYTEKDSVKFDCAINNSVGWIMYNKVGSTIKMMPLISAAKGCEYTLTEGTLTSTKSASPIVTVSDLWKTASNTTVFTLEKINTTLNIYMGEGVGSTLIVTLDNCNVVGFIASSTYGVVLNSCYATITQPKVLTKGIYQKVYELENKVKTGNSNTLSDRFKTMNVMISGDSITEVNFRASINWVGYINNWLGFGTCTNNAMSGTGLIRSAGAAKCLIERIDDWATGYDMILIMGNMNDYSDPTCFDESKLGTMGDTTISTQYGAIDVTIKKLIAKYPNASIGWVISTPRQYQPQYSYDTTVNSDGYLWGNNSPFEHASKAIQDVCGKYSIPCLDLYHGSGLRPWNADNRVKYFSCAQATDGDGVHPNADGHLLLAYKIYDFIKQYM